MTVLRGDNPWKLVFFDNRADRFNTNGEYIDPWGTPYRFDFSNTSLVRVWSCGPNRKDEGGAEGSDDIVSWRHWDDATELSRILTWASPPR